MDNINTTTNDPSTQGMIRNINQTVQEREVIKTAPDLMVYLDGKTYLLNPYITNTKQNQSYTFVSFNDYVQNFSSSVEVDTLVPSCNFTLQVPNMSKYLFQAPGGNNLITSMMEVQIFAKGYFASSSGNTVYHRVFKGVSAHVSHTDNGMFLEISVQCLGILHFMDFMHVDLNPSLLSNSHRPKIAMTSNQANMNPYEMLADVFLRGVTFEGFQLNAIVQDNLQGGTNQWHDAIAAGYCNKWQPILENLRKEVHILGYRMGEVLPSDINGMTQKSPDFVGSMDPTLRAADAYFSSIAQTFINSDFYVNIIRGYLPDFGTGAIQLVNGRIVSRLEKIRTISTMIGYEGFQDLDGTIIFKPPLYNLDVTRIGKYQPAAGAPQATPMDLLNLTETSNPFIVHLSEIESESESEDEQGIKATRMTIQTDWAANNKFMSTGDNLARPAVTHIDIPKLAKFGLREEPAHTLGWLGLQDKVAAYTYAVSELNRGNRGWRTYNLTIPLRPELKLGFPMYIPHRDMYGYIRTIGISYSQGGAATMSISLDTLRKRPVFHSPTQGAPNQANNPVLYTTQPNLVMQWTAAAAAPNTALTAAATAATGLATTITQLVGTPATQLQPAAKPIYAEEMEVVSARRNQYGTSWETKSDTRTKSFIVQNDVATPDDAKNLNGNGEPIQTTIDGKPAPFFSAANWYHSTETEPVITAPELNNQNIVIPPPTFNAAETAAQAAGNRGINMTYLQKILSCQPYTDEKGYELITPFPWGRWKTLIEAIFETHLGALNPNSTLQDVEQITGTDVFLFAGVGTPSSVDPSSTLQTQLNELSKVSKQAADATTFELVTPKPGDQQYNSLANMQPDANTALLNNQVSNDVGMATDMFLIGNVPPQQGSALALATNITDSYITDFGLTSVVPDGISYGTSNTSTVAFQTIENNQAVVGTTATKTTTQSQAFISKLVNSNSGTTSGQ